MTLQRDGLSTMTCFLFASDTTIATSCAGSTDDIAIMSFGLMILSWLGLLVGVHRSDDFAGIVGRED